jgi:DNA-binding response OmpR family regulator
MDVFRSDLELVTSSAPNAGRAVRALTSTRRELPDVDADDRQHIRDHPSPAPVSARDLGPELDPDRVARAVEELLRALAPAVADRIQVEVSLPSAAVAPALAAVTSAPPEPTGLTIDFGSRTLWVDGEPVELTRREFELLAYLQHRRGVALSRRELMDVVWESSYLEGDRTIDVHVRRLRVKLGAHADRITTLRGYGYRLD